jgi:2-hydroxychromene-2-carboxylate isomerase
VTFPLAPRGPGRVPGVTVESFTIYHSPNAYLGMVLAERLLTGVAHRRRPLLIPRARGVKVADLLGGKESPAKTRYHREDCLRWARRRGIPLTLIEPDEFARRAERWAASPFEREELPARAYHAALALGRGPEMDRALFAAAWVDGRDVNEEAVIRDAAAAAGLDPRAVLDRALGDDLGAEVRAALAAFDTLACPGVPTFVSGGQRYWGKDRVEELLADLRSPDVAAGAGP